MKRSRIPLVATWMVLIFFYLPIVILVIDSFNDSTYGSTWEGFTFRWYRALWEDEAIQHALLNTLLVGVTSMILSTALGTLGAFALHRYRKSWLQRAHTVIVWLPLMLPEILMGVSLLLFFGFLKSHFGPAVMVVAHTTFCLSYVVMVVSARLQDFDDALLEAAQDLGASWWQTTWRVLLPVLAPGIMAGALLAFTLSIDDFVISFFVKGPGMTTLPVLVEGMIKKSRTPKIINTLSTLMIFATFVLLIFSQLFTGNSLARKRKGKVKLE
ncbi:MAG: ABC transporter permease [Kiritimatiellaeota bacterium]|nr:ABC transporter permease [Kiritimatiellota bacterium]